MGLCYCNWCEEVDKIIGCGLRGIGDGLYFIVYRSVMLDLLFCVFIFVFLKMEIFLFYLFFKIEEYFRCVL